MLTALRSSRRRPSDRHRGVQVVAAELQECRQSALVMRSLASSSLRASATDSADAPATCPRTSSRWAPRRLRRAAALVPATTCRRQLGMRKIRDEVEIE
eukprot:1144199-Pyramimonas_sp.AAC.1